LKKKIIAIVFISLFITAVVYMIIEGSRPEILPIGSKLPKIEFNMVNGSRIIKADTLHKTVVIFFSEKCPHCKYELNILNENVEKIMAADFYLITIDKDIFTDGFTDKYPALQKADNIKFGIVKKEAYVKKFGILVTPTLYFFNTKGKLTAKIKGETKFERILKEL